MSQQQHDSQWSACKAWLVGLLQIAIQGLKFGVVGGAATVTHVVTFTLGIEAIGISPLGANFAGFCVAVIVSFLGHFHWTFRNRNTVQSKRALPARTAFVKFVPIALISLGLNTLTVYIVIDRLGLPYLYAIELMVTVVPACTFMLSKFWVFSVNATARGKPGRIRIGRHNG